MARVWLNIAEVGLRREGGVGAGASVGARWREVSRSWRAGAALVALCLAVYLPGQRSIPAVDRDEARFAQASRQMFEAAALAADAPERGRTGFYDGGWVVPKVQDRERLNKPPLIYWMQAASAWVCTGGDPRRDAIWMYRVPSVLGAMAAVLITWRLGCRMFDARAGWLAGAMLAVAPMVVWDAHQARSDSVMMAWTAGAMAGLWGVWRTVGARRRAPAGLADSSTSPGGTGGGWWWVAVLWVGVAAGVMTKGFVTPMVVGLAVVWLSWSTRGWRWVWGLRPVAGVVAIGLAVGPWVYWVAQHKGGVEAYARIVWEEFFVRGVAGSKEGHFWPPGMHTVALAVLCWPGSVMTLAGLVRAGRRGRGRTAGVARRGAWARERGG
ncbi:MAG: glycosyltransferase family 39 protein, partial [Phycisphaerae bacterium]|nr:glycosyltransferase family 39 protein [Phycisphaerae bacterium]